MPGGNLRLLVTSEEVCQKLAHETVTLMGNQYSFREFDVLGSRYFMDVFGIGPEMSTITVASALHRLGCDVLYENFREAVASKRLSMSTWRVYFRSTSCPKPLVVAGKVCEQICIEGRYYLARGKGAPLPVERLRMGQRSPHCLLLPVNTPNSTQRATKPPTPTTESKSVPSKRTGKTTKPAQEQQHIKDKERKSTSSNAKSTSKTDETFCPLTTTEANTSDHHQKASTSPVSEPEEKLGSSDSQPAEESKQAEESQPDSWTVVRSNNKRNRSLDSFKSLLSKAPPKKLEGLATSNFFDVLSTIDVEYTKIDVTTNPAFRKRYHIVPTNVVVPKDVATSKEAAHFFTKKHTKIVKDSHPTRVGEVVNLLAEDLLTA